MNHVKSIDDDDDDPNETHAPLPNRNSNVMENILRKRINIFNGWMSVDASKRIHKLIIGFRCWPFFAAASAAPDAVMI